MAAAPGSEGPDCNRTSAEHDVPQTCLCLRLLLVSVQLAVRQALGPAGAQRLRQRVFSRGSPGSPDGLRGAANAGMVLCCGASPQAGKRGCKRGIRSKGGGPAR